MANTTNDSHDIDIWFPDWLHVDWDDTNTCAYVTCICAQKYSIFAVNRTTLQLTKTTCFGINKIRLII